MKLSDDDCIEILKEARGGADDYLQCRKYKVSITTLENGKLRARAIEKGISYEDAKKWKNNGFAYDPVSKKPIF